MAVAHENAQLFRNIQRQATELAQEVAERKHSEAVLRSSEQRYRDLIAGSIQGITIYRNVTPLLVNRAFATIFGYTPRKSWRWRPLTGYSPPRSMIGCVAITTPVCGGRAPHSSTSFKGSEKMAPRSGWRSWPA
jgi:PAS domain-containing protein